MFRMFIIILLLSSIPSYAYDVKYYQTLEIKYHVYTKESDVIINSISDCESNREFQESIMPHGPILVECAKTVEAGKDRINSKIIRINKEKGYE